MIKHLAFEKYIYDYLDAHQIPSAGIKSLLHQHADNRHSRLQMLANYTIDQTHEAQLGLIIGQRITNTAYGLLGHALIHSNSLIDSYRILLRHIWIWQEQPRNAISLHLDDNYVYLNYNYPPAWAYNSQFLVDLFFSSNLKRSRELVEGNISGAFLRLRGEGDSARYEQLLEIPVEFNRNLDQLVIPRALAEAPLSSSIVSSQAYQRHCETLLRQLQSTTGLSGRIKLSFLHSGKTRTNEKDVAADMNVSVRTLRRQLRAQGTSYRELRRQIQQDLAQSYLRDTDLSVADIASLVNYFDTATFNRAFKKWLGCTPPQYRKSCRR